MAQATPAPIRANRARAPTVLEIRLISDSSCSYPEAEREGFEPSRELAPPTRLAGECLQPLGHLSGAGSIVGPCKGASPWWCVRWPDVGSTRARPRPGAVARPLRADLCRRRGALRLRRPRRDVVQRRRHAAPGGWKADPGGVEVGALPPAARAHPRPRRGLPRSARLHAAPDPLARRPGIRGP